MLRVAAVPVVLLLAPLVALPLLRLPIVARVPARERALLSNHPFAQRYGLVRIEAHPAERQPIACAGG